MICPKLDKAKIFDLADKYVIDDRFIIRNYKKGEEIFWAQVETAAGEFKTEEDALAHFEKEFGPYRDEMEDRCFFIEHKESGRVIGTATAWYNNDFKGENYGRVHWVGIMPEFQGRKLAKPLMAQVMVCLAMSHDKAYLTSQTTSYKAINMYKDFGFEPLIEDEDAARAWEYLEDILARYSGQR
jgi:ribosomal protein S18 acetylase RimI-like enzyme